MAWAAAFLYEATGAEEYLAAAEHWYQEGGCRQAWAFSWDSKAPGVQLLLLKLTKDEGKRAMYREDAENFVGGAMAKGRRRRETDIQMFECLKRERRRRWLKSWEILVSLCMLTWVVI
jgi:hypothetical protein